MAQPQQPLWCPRYIQNPLLLNGKKFDVRSYLLIACAMPYMVFFGHGYARLTLNLYDPHSSDLSSHLTNQVGSFPGPGLLCRCGMRSEGGSLLADTEDGLAVHVAQDQRGPALEAMAGTSMSW